MVKGVCVVVLRWFWWTGHLPKSSLSLLKSSCWWINTMKAFWKTQFWMLSRCRHWMSANGDSILYKWFFMELSYQILFSGTLYKRQVFLKKKTYKTLSLFFTEIIMTWLNPLKRWPFELKKVKKKWHMSIRIRIQDQESLQLFFFLSWSIAGVLK